MGTCTCLQVLSADGIAGCRDLPFAGILMQWHADDVSVLWHFLQLPWSDVAGAPGNIGCADGDDDLPAVDGRLHGVPAGCPVEQAVAEFTLEAVDLEDEDGARDAEVVCCFAQ